MGNTRGKEKKLKMVTFLARDGQIFFKVAKIICKKKNIEYRVSVFILFKNCMEDTTIFF